MEKKTTAAKPVVKTTEKEHLRSAVKETAAVKSAPAKESVKETVAETKAAAEAKAAAVAKEVGKKSLRLRKQ